MCCGVLRECCDSAGTARCLCGMCMPSLAGEGRRVRVRACACVRVSVRGVCACARRDGGACGMVDCNYGAGWDRDFRNRDIPIRTSEARRRSHSRSRSRRSRSRRSRSRRSRAHRGAQRLACSVKAAGRVQVEVDSVVPGLLPKEAPFRGVFIDITARIAQP
jgi:hypothetical protein